MIRLEREIENNRISAFVDGLFSGLGMILIIWGLASLSSLPSNPAVSITLFLVGGSAFAIGGFREAFMWGRFSVRPFKQIRQMTPYKPKLKPRQTETSTQMLQREQNVARVTEEQIVKYPSEKKSAETPTY